MKTTKIRTCASHFTISGAIAVGKTRFLKKFKEYMKGSIDSEKFPNLAKYHKKFNVEYEEPRKDILRMYYKCMVYDWLAYFIVLFMQIGCTWFTLTLIFNQIDWSSISGSAKDFIIVVEIIGSFMAYFLYYKLKVSVKNVCSLTCSYVQIYFWYFRLKGLRKNQELKGWLTADDRGWEEDKLFALMQNKQGLMLDIHYNIYLSIFEEYSRTLPNPTFWIFIDIDPRLAWKRLQCRIHKKKEYKAILCHPSVLLWVWICKKIGKPYDPEELITYEYMVDLITVYRQWRDEMKEKHKERFVIVGRDATFDEIVGHIERGLKEGGL